MIRVLFVCLGNICRSPMAEAIFASLVREAHLENEIEIDSAGTGDYHPGRPAHRGTMEVLGRNNISYDGRARQISVHDLTQFNYVVTMDESNFNNVRALSQTNSHVLPMLSFADKSEVLEVPDPYFTGDFDGVYQLIRAGCEGLLAHIRRENDL